MITEVVNFIALLSLTLFASSSVELVTLHVLHYEELVIEIKFIFANCYVFPVFVFDQDNVIIISIICHPLLGQL